MPRSASSYQFVWASQYPGVLRATALGAVDDHLLGFLGVAGEAALHDGWLARRRGEDIGAQVDSARGEPGADHGRVRGQRHQLLGDEALRAPPHEADRLPPLALGR